MCKVQIWKSPACDHLWITLAIPCEEGRNIDNCPTFYDLKVRPQEEAFAAWAAPESCPRCGKKDDYDGSQIRLIRKAEAGMKFGDGPSRSDRGTEFKGCNIM